MQAILWINCLQVTKSYLKITHLFCVNDIEMNTFNNNIETRIDLY